MNGLKRVISAISGEERDRTPFTLTLSLYGAKLTGCTLDKYYKEPDEYLKGQIEVFNRFEPDIVISPFALSFEGKAFGSNIQYFDNQAPNISKPAYNKLKDIKEINIPNIDKDEGLQYILNSIMKLSENFGGKTAIAGIISSPVDLPAIIFGIDLWLEMLLFEKKKAYEVIEATTEFFIKYANKMFEKGANFIVTPVMFCNPKIVTEEIIKNITVPALDKAYSKLKGPVVYHHGGNELAPFLNYIKDISNVIGFVLGISDDFDNARNIIGNQKVLLGNIEGPTLCKYPIESIKKITKRILENRKNDKHFIFASSGADFSFDTNDNQIAAITEVVKGVNK